MAAAAVDAFLATVMFRSATSNVAVLIEVVVPLTVKLPATVKSLNVTLLPVPTAWPILTAVPETVTPVPAVTTVIAALPSKLMP